MAVIFAPNSSDIVERCLQAIEQGEATVEQCVATYPGVEGLSEMLSAAMTARSIPRPVMSASAKKALEAQLIARMKTAKTRPQQSHHVQRWLRVPLTLAAMLVLVLGTGLGLARAAENTIPGDPLYGIKRASEQVGLFFADAPTRPEVLTHIAESRLTEIVTLVGLGRTLDESLITDTVHSLDAASAAQPDPIKRAALYEQGQRALELVVASGHTDQGASLSAAIKDVATPTFTPSIAPTAIPTDTQTPVPTETSTATPTLTPTPSDTPDELDTPDVAGATLDSAAATRRGPKRTPPAKPTKGDRGNGNGNGGDKGNMGGN